MAITLQYGANPTVAMMAAYQGGKNAYRNKQEEEYRRLYMQQQQMQQQAQLQREHLQSQYGLAAQHMGFEVGQQRERIGAEQGMLNQRMGAADIEDRNRRALDIWKWQNPPPKQPAPIAPRKPGDPVLDPWGDPNFQPPLQQIPQQPPPERIPLPGPQQPLAAYGLGGRPPTTAQQRGQEQSRARQQSLVESRRAYQIGLQGQSGSVNQTRYDPYLRRMVPVDEYRNYYGG